jgi:thioredoxin-related protein
MIDFTGWNCVNCRKMETSVLPAPEVLQRLQNNFIVLQLVIDDKTDLPVAEQTTSAFGKPITTLGGKWLNMEISKFNSNAQPWYVLIDSDGNTLVPPQGAVFNIPDFVAYLDSGTAAYKAK